MVLLLVEGMVVLVVRERQLLLSERYLCWVIAPEPVTQAMLGTMGM